MTDVAVRRTAATAPSSRRRASAVAELSDLGLVEGVVQHSQAALGEIFARHGNDMRRLAYGLRGAALADDVVQDVLLRLWRRPELFDPARGSLRAFLMMQTRARSIDLLRSDVARRTREETVDVSTARAVSPAVDDGALARLAGDHSWRLLSRLSVNERSAIALAYFGDYTYREVALLLGQPEGTIKSRIRSGLSRLRYFMTTDSPPATSPRPQGVSRLDVGGRAGSAPPLFPPDRPTRSAAR